MLILILFYTVIFAFLPPLTHRGLLSLHFIHALGWIVFHTFGLGLLLRAQSQKKFLVRHFLKHYYYPQNDGGSGAIQEAFANWKSLYNLSMCMTYGMHGLGAMCWEVTNRMNSVVRWSCMEDILYPT